MKSLKIAWWRFQRLVGRIDKPMLMCKIAAIKKRPMSIDRFRLDPSSYEYADRVEVGIGSYGPLDVLVHGAGDAKLKIGNYCSIGPGTRFILQSEHPYHCLSTYPFSVKLLNGELCATSKGSIIIGDDVWIGLGSIINSGTTIGQGAVVASGSVVVKNVEPYAIVGGNPARFIRWRFDDGVRAKLMTVDYSKLDSGAIKNARDLLDVEITDENVDEILHRLKGD